MPCTFFVWLTDLCVMILNDCEARPDVRIRVRGSVIRIDVSDTAIRIRVVVRAVQHTGASACLYLLFVFVCVVVCSTTLSCRRSDFHWFLFVFFFWCEQGQAPAPHAFTLLPPCGQRGFVGRDAFRFRDYACEGEARPDDRIRARGSVIRTDVSDTAIRIRDAARAVQHTGA